MYALRRYVITLEAKKLNAQVVDSVKIVKRENFVNYFTINTKHASIFLNTSVSNKV